MQTPEYKFKNKDTVLFITGVPLSGKSTIAPLVASSIEGCTVQPMDIFRLISQRFEDLKPEGQRNPFVEYGSCDSYAFVGDGRYSAKSLITGFNEYANVVSSILGIVMPNLQAEGVQSIIFEGVQLTPRIVAPYLNNPNNKLVIITSTREKLAENRQKLFGDDGVRQERYSDERLMLLQNEILAQSEPLPRDSYFIVDNSNEYAGSAQQVIDYLLKSHIIERRIKDK